MMSYEKWLEYILETVRAIASREHQEKVWLGPRSEINWVGDLYNALDEELFEDFFRRYSSSFSNEQLAAWSHFKKQFEDYGESIPDYPDPKVVMTDPIWQRVREAASRFVAAFEQKQSEPSLASQK